MVCSGQVETDLYRILYWQLLGMVRAYPKGSADWLEAECLHLLSTFEWKSHKLLDQLYLKILNYFYCKGIIYGTYGETPLADRVYSVYTHRLLIPLLVWFFQESKRVKETLPDQHGPWILNRLSRSGVDLASE